MAFQRREYVQAVKAAKAAGLEVYRTEIHLDGRVVLYHKDEGFEEETCEDFKARKKLEDEVNARVYARHDVKPSLTSQDRLNQKLDAWKAKADAEKECRRTARQERREAIKAGLEMPDLLTPETLARFWKVSARHVRRLCSTGELAAFRVGPKLYRIHPEDAVRYLDNKSSSPAAEPSRSEELASVGSSQKRPRLARLDIGNGQRRGRRMLEAL